MTDPQVFASRNPAAERSAKVQPPLAATNRLLWLTVLAPPAAWSVDELTAISLHHDYCAALLGRTFLPWHGITAILVGVGLAMLVVSLGAGVLAWRAHAVLGDDTGMGDTDVDRRRFMARAALLSCALFSYGILLRAITVAFVAPSHCGG